MLGSSRSASRSPCYQLRALEGNGCSMAFDPLSTRVHPSRARRIGSLSKSPPPPQVWPFGPRRKTTATGAFRATMKWIRASAIGPLSPQVHLLDAGNVAVLDQQDGCIEGVDKGQREMPRHAGLEEEVQFPIWNRWREAVGPA